MHLCTKCTNVFRPQFVQLGHVHFQFNEVAVHFQFNEVAEG